MHSTTEVREGARAFCTSVAKSPDDRAFFRDLGRGHRPHSIVIGCCDPRAVPNLITNAKLGELFNLTVAGNIAPVPDSPHSGHVKTVLRVALSHPSIKTLVVLGHSNCAAMKGIMAGTHDDPGLQDATTGLCASDRPHGDCNDDAAVNLLSQRNVIQQLRNVRQYPAVQAALKTGLNLVGLWFDIGACTMYELDESTGEFLPLEETQRVSAAVQIQQRSRL